MPAALTLGISTPRADPYTMSRKLKRGENVDIVVAQMIVTAVLLVGFAAEVLLGHFAGAK